MKTVTIYTTNTCHFCHLAKNYFQEHGVTYIEKNVESDPVAQREMIEKTGQFAVPVIEIAEEGQDPAFLIGFDREGIAAHLGIA
jgi:glutaredoxin 3